MKRSVLAHDRIRKIKGSFAFIEHRFLRDGFFDNLTHNEMILYLFLILVSDRQGISWYSYDRICRHTDLFLDDYIEARNGLIDKDMLAFDGHVFQVLSLPEQPVPFKKRLLKTLKDMDEHDPATYCSKLVDSMR